MSYERAMDPTREHRPCEQLELPFPKSGQIEFTAPANPDEFPEPHQVVFRGEMSTHLDTIYREGATPDLAFITLETAREKGLIGPLEYGWRRMLRWLRSLGTSKRSASSGARSARPTPGTGTTGLQ